MRRRGTAARPELPDWVVDFRCWDGLPDASAEERSRQWDLARWEWLDYYYGEEGVFVLDDREVEIRMQQRSER